VPQARKCAQDFSCASNQTATRRTVAPVDIPDSARLEDLLKQWRKELDQDVAEFDKHVLGHRQTRSSRLNSRRRAGQ
jgi:hypothetical protein